jgi:KDEL-tailed cysteine endopeptidase
MFRIFISLALLSASVSATVIDKFYQWAETHKIALPEGDHELLHILENWKNNDRIIADTNAKNLSYTLGHNAFSGMSSEEFAEHMHFGLNREILETTGLRGFSETLDTDLAETSVDWRTQNAVTPVKNQKQCGSCWSFSTTGALEGIYAIKRGTLVSYSEQQLVDCDYIRAGGTSLGCNGGDMKSAMEWIGKNNGLCTESAYPYVSGDTKTNGPCQKSCSIVSGSDISTTVSVSANSDSAMMTALAQQPVSIAIEADQSSFQLYKSGVFTGACGTNLDHGVLLVGYGTMNGLDYYILKNSWDVTWGSQGYMYIARGVDASGKPYNGGKGQCGLLMQGVYPVL